MITPEQRKYIETFSEQLTAPEIATALNKSVKAIREYCKRKGYNYLPSPKSGRRPKVYIPFQPNKITRHPAVYDNQKPSSYGVAYELHYSKKAS